MLQTIFIKPASGLCNMKCDYCFYCDEAAKREIESYGMMEAKTIENIIRKVLRQGKGNFCFAFQGGEPTLRGLEFFQKVIEFEKKYNVYQSQISNTLQTNGLYIDEQWCEFLKENEFLVGVSVDGTETIHNLHRHQKNGTDSYQKVRNSIELFDKYKIDYNILTVVTRQVAENIKDIYKEFKRRGWKYQQYITCLDPIGDEKGQQPYSLTPEIYGQFLVDLFQLWYKDWRRGKAPYIRQFENYIALLLGYPPESCDQRGICSVQCVTEADGSAYPCDFYVLDQYRLGNFNTNSIEEFFQAQEAIDFVEESKKWSDRCTGCKYFSLCRAGCRRSRVKENDSDTYYNYFCEGYYKFFEKYGTTLVEIAKFVSEQNKE